MLWLRRSRCVCVAAVVGSSAWSAVAGADVRLAGIRCAPGVIGCSGLTGNAFVPSWSSWDVRAHRYRVVQWERMTTKRPSRLPIKGRVRPFDLDIGFVHGSPRDVYSRCAADRNGPSRGCAVYAWDGSREQRLHAPPSTRPLHPAIGTGALAVAVHRR